MLAVLKIHAAYVPLDAGFPDDRMAYIVEDAGARLVLSLSRLRAPVGATCRRPVALPGRGGAGDRRQPPRTASSTRSAATPSTSSPTSSTPPAPPAGPRASPSSTPASATSSGSPPRSTASAPDDRVYQGMTIAFDFSVEEIWVPLVCRGDAGAQARPAPACSARTWRDFLASAAGHRPVLRPDAAGHPRGGPARRCASCWSPARPARRTWSRRWHRPGPPFPQRLRPHRGDGHRHLDGGAPGQAGHPRRAAADVLHGHPRPRRPGGAAARRAWARSASPASAWPAATSTGTT